MIRYLKSMTAGLITSIGVIGVVILYSIFSLLAFVLPYLIPVVVVAMVMFSIVYEFLNGNLKKKKEEPKDEFDWFN